MGGQVGGIFDLVVLIHDAPHDHHGILCLGCAEGLATSEKYVHEDAQAPPTLEAEVWCESEVSAGMRAPRPLLRKWQRCGVSWP